MPGRQPNDVCDEAFRYSCVRVDMHNNFFSTDADFRSIYKLQGIQLTCRGTGTECDNAGNRSIIEKTSEAIIHEH